VSCWCNGCEHSAQTLTTAAQAIQFRRGLQVEWSDLEQYWWRYQGDAVTVPWLHRKKWIGRFAGKNAERWAEDTIFNYIDTKCQQKKAVGRHPHYM
jgi:hypothetical protein